MANYWSSDRELRFSRIIAEAAGFGLKTREICERARPWGGYLLFENESLEAFRDAYWRKWISPQWGAELARLWEEGRERPEWPFEAKLLLLEPGKRFSLQTHERRDELWRVIEGPVTVVIGDYEDDLNTLEMRPGEVIRIGCGQLHRAAAPALHWAVLAEFWHHTPGGKPSDEKDVIHYADDYRKIRKMPPRRLRPWPRSVPGVTPA